MKINYFTTERIWFRLEHYCNLGINSRKCMEVIESISEVAVCEPMLINGNIVANLRHGASAADVVKKAEKLLDAEVAREIKISKSVLKRLNGAKK